VKEGQEGWRAAPDTPAPQATATNESGLAHATSSWRYWLAAITFFAAFAVTGPSAFTWPTFLGFAFSWFIYFSVIAGLVALVQRRTRSTTLSRSQADSRPAGGVAGWPTRALPDAGDSSEGTALPSLQCAICEATIPDSPDFTYTRCPRCGRDLERPGAVLHRAHQSLSLEEVPALDRTSDEARASVDVPPGPQLAEPEPAVSLSTQPVTRVETTTRTTPRDPEPTADVRIADVRYCHACGREKFDERDRHCRNCGARLT
jgi:hypothetical protein